MFGKRRNETSPSKKGSEVYIHSGLEEPWGSVDMDGLKDPDEVRDIVEIMEEADVIDDTAPNSTSEKERIKQKFIATTLARIAVSESDVPTTESHDSKDDLSAA